MAPRRVTSKDEILEYDDQVVLGRGAYGIVFNGSFQQVPVAVKRTQVADQNDEITDREEKAFKRLIIAMSSN